MVNSIDGNVEVNNALSSVACCPPDICNVLNVSSVCTFLNILPSGPMWDADKIRAREKLEIEAAGGEVAQPEECDMSVTWHAVYAGRKLLYLLENALWPALRESNPDTAVTTLDLWLERLGWENCFTACRGAVTGCANPFIFISPCGPTAQLVACADVAVDRAIKRAIVRALWRLQMGIPKNMSALNFVIEPLGAVLSVDDDPRCYDEFTCEFSDEQALAPTCCEPWLKLERISDYIEAAPTTQCTSAPVGVVPACCDIVVDGQPKTVCPALMAAECIVRSVFTPGPVCNINIRRID